MQPSEEDGWQTWNRDALAGEDAEKKPDIPAPFPDIAVAVTGASLRLYKNID